MDIGTLINIRVTDGKYQTKFLYSLSVGLGVCEPTIVLSDNEYRFTERTWLDLYECIIKGERKWI